MLIRSKTGTITSGAATRDAEFKHVGEKNTPLCKFSIVAVEGTADKTAIFVNVIAWFDLAKYAENIKKFDRIFVSGVEKDATYTNKEGEVVPKTELVADFIQIQLHAEKKQEQAQEKKAAKKAPEQEISFSISEPIEEDDLPF